MQAGKRYQQNASGLAWLEKQNGCAASLVAPHRTVRLEVPEIPALLSAKG